MNGKRFIALLAALAMVASLAACQNNREAPEQPEESRIEMPEKPEVLPAGIYFSSTYETSHEIQITDTRWQADEEAVTMEFTVSSPYSGGWMLEVDEYGIFISQDEDGLVQGEQKLSIPIPLEQARQQMFLLHLQPDGQPEEFFHFQLPRAWNKEQVYQLQDGSVAQAPLKKFADVRGEQGIEYDLRQIASISEEQLCSLSFDQQTIFPEKGMPENLTPEQLMEQAMDPGLGIRQLHQQGITGQGVSVAIIDLSIPEHHLTEHPEYAGKFAVYQNFTDQDFSMHGPAVASLLVGENCGVAPGAKLYYVSANSWDRDAKYYADALNWLIDLNQTLPEGEKIRVVSVSAAPGSVTGPFTKNNELWEQARQRALDDGILVLDVTEKSGIQISRGYSEPGTNQEPEKLIAGAPNTKDALQTSGFVGRQLHVPTSCRTTAGMWVNREDSQYTYWGVGGLSWGIPYAAGVLALGWQVQPEATPEQMLDLLLETAAKNSQGFPCINPPAFLQALSEQAN